MNSGVWLDLAACAAHPVDLWFDDDREVEAKAVCHGCPVRTDCLAYAFQYREFEYGIYGGLTARERRRVWRARGRRHHRPATAA